MGNRVRIWLRMGWDGMGYDEVGFQYSLLPTCRCDYGNCRNPMTPWSAENLIY